MNSLLSKDKNSSRKTKIPLKRRKFLLKEPREIVITAAIKSNLLCYDLASKKLIDNPIPALSVLQKAEMSQAE